MLIGLLLVTAAVSLATCFVVARIFRMPIGRIMERLVADGLGTAWQRYISFAIYVVGLSSGVRIWSLEQYVNPMMRDGMTLELTPAHWVIEIYRSIISTLQGITWMLLIFFIFSLIAYVILRGFELRQSARDNKSGDE